MPEIKGFKTPAVGSAIRDDAPVELGSFAQNIVTLESILFRANQELKSPAVNVDRLHIYLSEMQSIHQELIDQQARAVAARGISADDVERLQGLLSGPLMDIVHAADRHVVATQAKLDALSLENWAQNGAPPLPPVDSKGAQGDDGGMEARIAKLEADLTAIKIDIGVIKANGATKSDIADLRGAFKTDVADLKTTIEGVKTTVAEAKTAMIMWAVGAILVSQLLPAVKEFLSPAQKAPAPVHTTAPPSATVPAATANP